MPNQAYFPKNAADCVVWLVNFIAKLKVHASQIDLTPKQISDILDDLTYYLWLIQYWYPAMQQNSLEATAYRDLIATGSGNICRLPTPVALDQMPPERAPGILPRLFNTVQRIKLSEGYTESIGQDLGIIGKMDNTPHPVSEFSLTGERGDGVERVKISFIKHDHDGVYIESRRANGEWEFLSVATSKPYIDTRPLLEAGAPEIREYRMRWWTNGVANGDFTAIQRITVSP